MCGAPGFWAPPPRVGSDSPRELASRLAPLALVLQGMGPIPSSRSICRGAAKAAAKQLG